MIQADKQTNKDINIYIYITLLNIFVFYLFIFKDSSGLVFNNKAKALKEMKKYKDARFKSFQTLQEAEEFTKSNLAVSKSFFTSS